MDRYLRQTMLKGFGPEKQAMLAAAKVLVVGAGGLGCPALLYLAAAGVGTLGIVDGDTIHRTNLHRQILYQDHQVGQSKVIAAKTALLAQNPEVNILTYPYFLQSSNALDIIAQYDLVVDGTDNFAARYMLNDACVLLGKPLVYGAINASEGQVAVFNAFQNGIPTANYRDLFPEPPLVGTVLNCAEAGVIGVLPGIIGTMQAAEAIKMLAGWGTPLVNQLLIYDLMSHTTFVLQLVPRLNTRNHIPQDTDTFSRTNYVLWCNNPVQL